jgi:hypothetical protein
MADERDAELNPSVFAHYLEDLLRGEGYWDNEAVIPPMNACVAVLSLLQYLLEAWKGLPEPLLAPMVGSTTAWVARSTSRAVRAFGDDCGSMISFRW